MLKNTYQHELIEVGVDEAGRGCLAGPVFAAAVILPEGFDHHLLNDSKKITASTRNILREIIEEKAISWAVASANHQEIDQINIANASYLAMNRAIEKLNRRPEFVLVDGKFYKPDHDLPYCCIIQGDGKYKSIAAASILAKTHRDQYMQILDKQYPQYGFQKNKGYPTPEHKMAVYSHGLSPIHRRTFGGFDQLSLNFDSN